MNETAFQRLLETYYQEAFVFCKSLVKGDEEAASDLIQTASMRAWQNREMLLDIEKFKSWFFTIVYRAYLQHYRSEIRRKSRFTSYNVKSKDDSHDEWIDAVQDPKDQVNEMLVGMELERALSALKRRMKGNQREVLMTQLDEELSYEDLARRFKMPMGTLKALLFRARQTADRMVGADVRAALQV